MSTIADDKLIQKAIREKLKLRITVLHGNGRAFEIEFDPYVFGNDSWQRPFVWGLTPALHCYRFYLDWIRDVALEGRHFKVDPNACYYYAMEEEIYASVADPGIEQFAYSHLAPHPVAQVASSFRLNQEP